ncbi:MAG: beta strand repeat-containing protein, partial [bacterium]
VTVLASGSGKIITVTDGVRQTSSNAFNVDPGGLAHFAIASIGSQSAGKNFTVAVTAKDANNNDVSHTGIVTLSDNTGTLTASILVFTGQISQSVTDVKIKKAKSDAVITANGSGKSGSSNAFAVNSEAGTLDHFVVTNTSGENINSPQTAGAAFNIKIVAQDQFDNTATDFNETVTITDLGTLNLTSANFVNGELASQSVTINQARLDNQLTVTGGTPARSGASNLFNVIAGGLAGFTIDPVSDQATNAPFTIVIRALDANGNLATSFSSTVTINDLTGTIAPVASGTFINGVKQESVRISQTRNGDVITVSSAGKTGSSNAFNVTAVSVDHFVINTIGNQTAGQPFPVTITAQDASNNTVTAFNGTVTMNDLSGAIAPVTSNPFTSGTLTQNFTITKSFTNNRITVTGLGKSNTSNPFNVIAGNLHHFAIETVPNQSAGAGFPITITAQDINNNTVTSFGGTVTIAINSGSITPAVSGAFANGVRIESVTIPNVGNNRIISVNDGSGHPGASNAFNVAAGGLDHFVFNTIATQTAGLLFSFTITAKDFNNNDVSFTGTVTFSDNTGTLTPASVAMNGVSVTVNNAQITKAQTGVVITATGGGKTGASNAFMVNPGTLSRVRIVQGNSGPGTEFTTYTMTADDQVPLHAAGYDALDNYISDPPVNWVVTPSAAPPFGVVNPAASSSSTIFSANRVTTAAKIIADHATAIDDTTGNITIATGVANSVRVLQGAFGPTAPVGNVTLNSGDPLPMHAGSVDADGNRIGDVSVTWRVNGNMGFVNPTSGTNTTFTATTAGTGTVTADHATLNDGSTGIITVNPNTLSFIRIMDGASGNTTQVGNRTVRTDETLPVHAAGFDVNGNYLGDQSVTWSISDPIGTLSSSSGINTTFDPKTPGTGVITATHSTAGNASTGTITVITGPPHHIKILKDLSGPAQEATSDSLFTGETRDFHASSFDIDNNRLADVSVTWMVSGGIGTLNPLLGTSTTLTANTVGFGVITAQHATLGNDQTGVIKVKPGSLSYVRIVEGPSGPGSKLGAISRNTDQAVTVHAAGYDASNSYLGDQPVTWSVIGANIGTLDNLSGTSTTLTLRTPGAGRIVADHVSANDDTSGAITVSTGALHHVKVLTGTQNETVVVTDHSMNADEAFDVHAGGYDADDNYRGDEPVNWTVTGVIGTLTPINGISTTLNARKVGNGQIKA